MLSAEEKAGQYVASFSAIRPRPITLAAIANAVCRRQPKCQIHSYLAVGTVKSVGGGTAGYAHNSRALNQLHQTLTGWQFS